MFDATRKLLQMAWFQRLYDWFIWCARWAHAQTETGSPADRQLDLAVEAAARRTVLAPAACGCAAAPTATSLRNESSSLCAAGVIRPNRSTFGAHKPRAVNAKPNDAAQSRTARPSAAMPVMTSAEASTMPIWNAAEANP